MKLEVGKSYRTRGDFRLIYQFQDDGCPSFLNENGEEVILMPDMSGGAHGDDYDIISEWQDEPRAWDLPYVVDKDGNIKQVEPSYETKLRDQAALAALQGLLSHSSPDCGNSFTAYPAETATCACEHADAFMAERSKRMSERNGGEG